MDGEIINRVANSNLLQIDMEDWYPKGKRFGFDIADFLYEGLILKELDFRSSLKVHDWTLYKDSLVAVFCSADAIIPTWAFMLISQYLSEKSTRVFFAKPEQIDEFLYQQIIDNLDLETYRDQKVIVKGCSKLPVPVSAYVAITSKLTPVVQSLMFGEPCSNVPLFKRKKVVSI
jgi:hypothetical protein